MCSVQSSEMQDLDLFTVQNMGKECRGNKERKEVGGGRMGRRWTG